jgi:phosphatidylglycerol:prolipoprotein diacylglycerol transferase
MLLAQLTYPEIDPVAVQLGPIAIRWYSLAYLVGLLAGTWLIARRGTQRRTPYTPGDAYDFLAWVTLGLLIGARLGLVIFYYPSMIWESPGDILAMWKGGMSFHGGAIGVVLTTVIFCKIRNIPILAFGDEIGAVAPIGLLCGRIANFINGELWGRVAESDVPWAMVFPGAGSEPRHPSQLYEALTEGVLLFIVANIVRRKFAHRTAPGIVTGTFFAGYAVARFSMEFFRQPDEHLGYLFLNMTMGQLLTLPMLAIGVWLIVRAAKNPAITPEEADQMIQSRSKDG